MFKHLEEFRKLMGIKEEEYLGNIWGWTVSYIGLALLTFLIALYFYRATYYPQNVTTDPIQQTEQIK